MAIHSLPPVLARSLGAAQVLPDSRAVVKELIENALDARATSISVQISKNTVDEIKVSDNGHGVVAQDRCLLAKRHHTSKILDCADLDLLGGRSLGFRGEALASMAQSSEALVINTRVEGEALAVSLRINPTGETIEQTPTSAPVGTTVRVLQFLVSNPVRRQMASKNADQTMKHIKRLLQAHALARPHVRFSLNIIKAASHTANWLYVPNLHGPNSAKDAVLKVCGLSCASQCKLYELVIREFKFSSVLPRNDAEGSQIANLGAFLSVDRRPLDISRGFGKDVVKLWREKSKALGLQWTVVKDTFMQIDIACPPGSYDVNVETLKDDVLFADVGNVSEAVKEFFATVYADTDTALRSEVGEGGPVIASDEDMSLQISDGTSRNISDHMITMVRGASSQQYKDLGSIFRDDCESVGEGADMLDKTSTPDNLRTSMMKPFDHHNIGRRYDHENELSTKQGSVSSVEIHQQDPVVSSAGLLTPQRSSSPSIARHADQYAYNPRLPLIRENLEDHRMSGALPDASLATQSQNLQDPPWSLPQVIAGPGLHQGSATRRGQGSLMSSTPERSHMDRDLEQTHDHSPVSAVARPRQKATLYKPSGQARRGKSDRGAGLVGDRDHSHGPYGPRDSRQTYLDSCINNERRTPHEKVQSRLTQFLLRPPTPPNSVPTSEHLPSDDPGQSLLFARPNAASHKVSVPSVTEHEHGRPEINAHQTTPFAQRHNSGLRRSGSEGLPLERVPVGQAVQNLIFCLRVPANLSDGIPLVARERSLRLTGDSDTLEGQNSAWVELCDKVGSISSALKSSLVDLRPSEIASHRDMVVDKIRCAIRI